jgi:hypothetical protein
MSTQVNIKLTVEQMDLLEAAVFLRRLKSSQDLIRPLVLDLLAELAENPAIIAAVAQRAKPVTDETDEKVTPLAPRRRKSSRPGPSASS